MSFLIRQIALKSSGEEIVRGSRVDGDELTIGRDAAAASTCRTSPSIRAMRGSRGSMTSGC
jgi:hypothetical protein